MFINFTSIREQDKAYINSSQWSMLMGLEPAYICMWVSRSTIVQWTPKSTICTKITLNTSLQLHGYFYRVYWHYVKGDFIMFSSSWKCSADVTGRTKYYWLLNDVWRPCARWKFQDTQQDKGWLCVVYWHLLSVRTSFYVCKSLNQTLDYK